jgi:hypothetical protein
MVVNNLVDGDPIGTIQLLYTGKTLIYLKLCLYIGTEDMGGGFDLEKAAGLGWTAA